MASMRSPLNRFLVYIFEIALIFPWDADGRTPKTEELQQQKNSNDIRTPIF